MPLYKKGRHQGMWSKMWHEGESNYLPVKTTTQHKTGWPATPFRRLWSVTANNGPTTATNNEKILHTPKLMLYMSRRNDHSAKRGGDSEHI